MTSQSTPAPGEPPRPGGGASAPRPPRLAVFTENPGHGVCRNILEISAALGESEWLVLVHSPPRGLRRLVRNNWRELRRNGWRWIPYQLGDAARHALGHFRSADDGPRAPGGRYTRASIAREPNVRVTTVENIHSGESLALVREFAPDLGLSLAAPILREPLFAIPRLGTVNLHKGKVPDYRGMPPAFWELWNDEDSVGCTVHWVEAGLDTGDVVASTTVHRRPFSTLEGLQLELEDVGIGLFARAVKAVLDGNAQARPQAGKGRLFRKPTLGQLRTLRARLAALQPAPPGGMGPARLRSAVHAGTGLVPGRLWARALGPRVSVLLYHRVSDEARDNLTVGVEQFDRQMRFLSQHCRVLPVEALLRNVTIAESDRPQVCVTFDDGYLDNYAHAAPILLRNRIPAAFFVSTGLVGSKDQFPHDLERGNEPIPLMEWSHLERIRDEGFTVGSHTVSHIDCATAPADVVRKELDLSMMHLRERLQLEEVVFAYPYGGRQHMTPERLELVKQAGYAGCLSAYGGFNTRRVDRFNVLRAPVNWEFSDAAFRNRCLGLR